MADAGHFLKYVKQHQRTNNFFMLRLMALGQKVTPEGFQFLFILLFAKLGVCLRYISLV